MKKLRQIRRDQDATWAERMAGENSPTSVTRHLLSHRPEYSVGQPNATELVIERRLIFFSKVARGIVATALDNINTLPTIEKVKPVITDVAEIGGVAVANVAHAVLGEYLSFSGSDKPRKLSGIRTVLSEFTLAMGSTHPPVHIETSAVPTADINHRQQSLTRPQE